MRVEKLRRMNQNKLILSENNHHCLVELTKSFAAVDPELKKCVEILKNKLRKSQIKRADEIPHKQVQLSSIVSVNTSFGRKVGLEIVLPEEADYRKRKLSVLSPLGVALIGRSEGTDTVWHFPRGDEKVSIEYVDNSLLKIANELDG
jgi:regulator of nucleoside diphosphate kinase